MHTVMQKFVEFYAVHCMHTKQLGGSVHKSRLLLLNFWQAVHGPALCCPPCPPQVIAIGADIFVFTDGDATVECF